MSESHRIADGLVDRTAVLGFSFNGRGMAGHPGDTLASALLANGRRMVGRSFKYHRPRGVFSAGSEEPNALVQLGSGARTEPNTRATTVELFDGLEATSQHHKLSLDFDPMAANNLLSPFLAAGFYYKTFMWPRRFWEKLYEPLIRASAGLGRLSMQPDPDAYDKGFRHCDILVIGAGPAGLSAALTAGRTGARVVLADEDFLPGGRLNSERFEIDGAPGSEWAAKAAAELDSLPNVKVMRRSTVYGAFDHGVFGVLERVADHLPDPSGKPRQILWRLYAKRSILCAGAIERPIAFGNNDRPGVMLAGAARSYLNRFGVAAGMKAAVFTNNDDGWRTAADLSRKDVEVTAVIDTRDGTAPVNISGASIVMGGRVIGTAGRKALRSITLAGGQVVPADCLAVSGGWNPNVHLACHLRGRPVWNPEIAAFVPPEELPPGMAAAGAAGGSLGLSVALKQGAAAGKAAAADCGFKAPKQKAPRADDESGAISAFWHVSHSKGNAWVDFQNDVTFKDIGVSFREGFRAVEHLKRYTTLGMGTDQGKTANVPALAIMAEMTGRSIKETGTTVYRPPYTPVPISAFAGRARGKDFRPARLTPSHVWAERRGAVFVESGAWLRAQWFPKDGEDHWRQSVDREVVETRGSVGVCDVSTLGKIDIQGRDANEFLNRVYANGFSTLQVGKVRYGLMLREDGIAYDDGTTARLGESHYVMTTTTANAGLVFAQLEFARQCLWPGLDVHLISTTDGWAQFAVAGPNSRNLLIRILDPEHDISNEAFPFMACGEFTACGGHPVRLFRISFSGELAYEIAVPSKCGRSMMAALLKAGEAYGAIPYGLEALGVMRIEKGHPAGNELNGQTTALNLGLDRFVSRKKDCIGGVLSRREALQDKDAMTLAGFRPVDREQSFNAGAHFFADGAERTPDNDEGWMSSVAYSPMLGHTIGLGFIRRGHERRGETVTAADPLRKKETEVEIVSPHFFDPDGERLRA